MPVWLCQNVFSPTKTRCWGILLCEQLCLKKQWGISELVAALESSLGESPPVDGTLSPGFNPKPAGWLPIFKWLASISEPLLLCLSLWSFGRYFLSSDETENCLFFTLCLIYKDRCWMKPRVAVAYLSSLRHLFFPSPHMVSSNSEIYSCIMKYS